LEPAFFAKPILSGPFYHKNKELFQLLIDAEALIVVESKVEIRLELEDLIASAQKRKIMGICGQKLTEANSKIVYNVANKLKEFVV